MCRKIGVNIGIRHRWKRLLDSGRRQFDDINRRHLRHFDKHVPCRFFADGDAVLHDRKVSACKKFILFIFSIVTGRHALASDGVLEAFSGEVVVSVKETEGKNIVIPGFPVCHVGIPVLVADAKAVGTRIIGKKIDQRQIVHHVPEKRKIGVALKCAVVIMTAEHASNKFGIHLMIMDFGNRSGIRGTEHIRARCAKHENENNDDKGKNNVNQPRLLAVAKSLESHSKSISNK